MAAKKSWILEDSKQVFDIGQNMTGWCRIEGSGAAGAEVTLEHAELLDNNEQISHWVLQPYFQTDKYILRGDGLESWEPRFTYHGFRYARVTVKGDASI
ncbi:MAG: family 78 glycoside hydrolase catalytic domain [Lentisphaerae bacterium]|nr:family 78 glycoside hydrolase catalytic domain [Lentisphaerota bacterium]MCP4103640.1 family 78 glycoside hydrolase catalytic domain [Lentisphaerota bacterium]